MKRLTFVLSLIAAVIACASCRKDAGVLSDGDEVSVRLTVVLPSSVEARAISKAENVDVVYYEIWNGDWTERLFVTGGAENLSAEVVNNQAVLELILAKGLTYNMIFWAQDSSFDGYDVSDLQNVRVDYSRFEGNQDRYDAFYAVPPPFTVKENMNETIVLRRPFAQLNFGASEMDTDLGNIVVEDTEIKVSQLATVFDTRLGVGKEQVQDVVFSAEGIATDELLETDGKTYAWVAMNYMLMMDERDAVTVNASFAVEGLSSPVKHKVSNVPLHRNHRTNIVGDLFTSDAVLQIIVDHRFEEEEHIENI